MFLFDISSSVICFLLFLELQPGSNLEHICNYSFTFPSNGSILGRKIGESQDILH
jgi:hypothetical protein